MEVIKYNDSLCFNKEQSIISIGNFDGVHAGHQHILKELVQKSGRCECKSVAMTFEPHPRILFSKYDNPFLLSTFTEKINLIGKYAIDCLVYFEFDKKFASVPADVFVREILVDKFRAKEVIVGYDFNFGRDRAGSAEFLEKMGKAHGFGVTVIQAMKISGEIVSSSNIRRMIAEGDVRKAAMFLSRNYSLTGKVIRGKDIGKKIGFPTANISVKGKIVPADGVYSVIIRVGDKKLCGVANIGYQPTFGAGVRSIEAHIIDFDEELYEREITVEFVDRLRDEKKFQNVRELTNQIKKDVQTAQASLAGSI